MLMTPGLAEAGIKRLYEWSGAGVWWFQTFYWLWKPTRDKNKTFPAITVPSKMKVRLEILETSNIFISYLSKYQLTFCLMFVMNSRLFWRYKTWELLTSVERISSQRSCFCFHLNLTQFACFRDKQKTLESKYLNSGSDQRSWSYNIVRGGRVGCNKHCFHWKLYQARLGERYSKLHNCFVTMI